MNDFLATELARDQHARLSQAARTAALARAAEREPHPTRRGRRHYRLILRPRRDRA